MNNPTKLNSRQRLYVRRYCPEFSDHRLAEALHVPRSLVESTLARLDFVRSVEDVQWIKDHPHDRPPKYAAQIPVPRIVRKLNRLDHVVAMLTAVVVMAVYVSTLPPTVTGEDSGEFIVAAYTLGIPHPPGYPLWTLLAHVFTYVPFGSVAWRVALSSAVFASVAVLLLVLLTIKITNSRPGGVAAGLVFAFASEVWEQSVIVEVYALNILLIAGCFFCFLLWYEQRRDIWLYILALVYGLSLTNHSTARVLGPVFLLFVVYLEPLVWKRWRTYATCIGLALLGLSVYLYLPLRSLMDPYLDWGDPETLRNFIAVIRQEQFSFLLTENERTPELMTKQMGIFITNWALAFTPWLIPLPFVGLYALYRHDRTVWKGIIVLALVFSIGLVLALNYGTDKQDRWINHVFFIPFYFVAALLAGGAVAWLGELRIKQFSLRPLAAVGAVAAGLFLVITHYERNDKSSYWFAHDFGSNILNSLAPGALYLPTADHATFPAMYLQKVEGLRPDVEIADKYGYIEPHLYESMPEQIRSLFRRIPTPAEEKLIESWIAMNDQRPLYVTTKRAFPEPRGTVVTPYGLAYRVLRPNETPDAESPWMGYKWHTVHPADAHGEFTAELILGDYLFAKGQELLLLGEMEKGVAALENVVQIQGENEETLNNLGSACADVGQMEAAADFYARAVALAPAYVTALRNLARTEWTLQRYEALLKTTDLLVAEKADDYETHWYRGRAQQKLGMADDAITTYMKLLQSNPMDADAHRELGMVYLELKDDREAAEDLLRRSFAIDSSQPELMETVQQHGLDIQLPEADSAESTEAPHAPNPTPTVPELPLPPNLVPNPLPEQVVPAPHIPNP